MMLLRRRLSKSCEGIRTVFRLGRRGTQAATTKLMLLDAEVVRPQRSRFLIVERSYERKVRDVGN